MGHSLSSGECPRKWCQQDWYDEMIYEMDKWYSHIGQARQVVAANRRHWMPGRKDHGKTSMKQEKYIHLWKGIKNLNKEHTVSQMLCLFELLGGYFMKIKKELNHITGTDKETEYIIIKCQKWLLSQNNEIVKNSMGIYNDYNSVTCNAETAKHRCLHPHCCKRKYIEGTNNFSSTTQYATWAKNH